MKHFKSFVFCAVMLMLTSALQPLAVYAEENYETQISDEEALSEGFSKEALDNDFSTAVSIGLNTSRTDNLTSSSDVKCYKFTVPSAGYISLTLTHEYIESGLTYWKASLYDSAYSQLASYSFEGSTTSYTKGKIGVSAGTYYLKINDNYYSDKNYSIRINYVSSDAWETEFNDSYSTADSINVNTTCYGSMRTSDDADWYKFTVPSAGYISLTFTHEYIESGLTYWKASLYDSAYSQLASYSFEGSTTSYTKGKIGVSAGTYYLKINDNYYSDKNYSIRINYVSSDAWETEFNDSYSTADSINVNTTCYGSMRTGDDADWYQFTLSKAGMQTLYFDHDYIASGLTYWRLYLYDSSMTEIGNWSYGGNTVSYSHNLNLPAGTYYIKIIPNYYSDAGYNFEVSLQTFRDVKDTAFYYDAVNWALENEVTNGITANRFGPNIACTRAHMVSFLWKAKGSPEPTITECPFTDVRPDSYYYDAVLWALENEVTSGTTATTFSPSAVLTRAQCVSFLYKDAGRPDIDAQLPFKDVKADAFYADAVRWAAAEKITAGTTPTTFSPNANCTRGQIVTFLYNAMNGAD